MLREPTSEYESEPSRTKLSTVRDAAGADEKSLTSAATPVACAVDNVGHRFVAQSSIVAAA
jgi:hypothetical protein